MWVITAWTPLVHRLQDGYDIYMHMPTHRSTRIAKSWSTALSSPAIAMPIIAGLTLAGLGLRIYHASSQSVWLDEAFSIWIARHDVHDLLSWVVKIDQHPPLYYLLLAGWIRLLGWYEAQARLFSAIWGVLTIPVMYSIGRRLGGLRLGLIAALLLTISPFHVQFAQEMRMYTMLTFWASLTLWGLVAVLTAPRAKHLQHPQGQRFTAAWLALACGSAAAVLTHNTAVFLPLAVGLYLLGWMYRNPPARGRLAHNAILAGGLFILLWSLWLPAAVHQTIGVIRRFWIPPPTLQSILGMLHAFDCALAPKGIPWQGLGDVLYPPLALLGFVSWWRAPRDRWKALLLATLFVVPIAGELIFSLWRPIFYTRTLIWITLPYYLFVAQGLLSLRTAPYRAITLALLVAVSALSLHNLYTNYQKEGWRQAAAYVAERAQPGDMILFNATWVQIPFDYYFERYSLSIPEHGAPVDLFDRGELEPQMTEADVPRLEQLIQSYERVWLVYSHDWYTDPRKIIPRVLSQEMRKAEEKRFVGIRVMLYTR
ncbi:MAG: glycosyltransferase family 39 protein [Anaerolineae bacterium]|nr:glycosyltransferase family 39 protein [Anaerolineae bacterium]